MQRTFFVVLAAVGTILVGTALPNLGTAHASTVVTPAADRAAVVVLAGSANLAPIAMQTRDDFVRETNSSQATQVLTKLGTSALWTYNPAVQQFQPLATTTPRVGSAIYVRPSTSATLQRLSNPSWAAAVTATPNDTRTATYNKDRVNPGFNKAAFKAATRVKPKTVLKSTKVIPKVTPTVHKTSVVATTEKSAVVVTTKKTVTPTVTTKKSTVVTKTPVRTPVKRTRTKAPKQVVVTTVPATATTTAPPTTVATTSVPPTSGGSALAPPPGYTASELEFSDTAAGGAISSSNWNTYITSNAAQGTPWNTNGAGGSTPAASNPDYNAEYDLPGQVSEGNGVIDIRATETPTKGVLDGAPTEFQWASGALSSYNKFQFDGGYVQIEAKMPAGSGMWPGLWMLPGPGSSAGDNYELDIFEGGYNDGGAGTSYTDMDAWHLHTPNGTFGADSNTNVNLTTAFNTYGLKWVPGQSITWYLNGNVIGTVTSAEASIPNEPMELIMNLQVAANTTSGWHSLVNSSTPVNNDMLVSDVQVYS
jgi:beta-glucanase (GH16 family)